MSERDAIEIAAEYAQKQGWTWLEPVECRRRFRWFRNLRYVVHTNRAMLGVNVVVEVDAISGAIISAHFRGR